MDTSRNIKYYNDLDDEGRFDWDAKTRRRAPKPKPARVPVAIQQFVQTQDDTRKTFDFAYRAARFEESWLLDSLGFFYEEHWISDVLCKVKGGKEASVYLCKSGEQLDEPLVVAKVYRPRMLRNLKNDQAYRQGRDVLDEDGKRIGDLGMLKAEYKRSVYGEQIRHQSWIAYEFQTLKTLHAAGADVPRPYATGHNAILMGYIGDEAVAAPTLNSVALEPDEVKPLFERVFCNIDLMLSNGIIHGDLSAYNVLYWEGDIALIDFPQVVSPEGNRNAFAIFERDVTRLCEYFIAQGLTLAPQRIAADLWTAYGYRVRQPIDPLLLDADDPGDKELVK